MVTAASVQPSGHHKSLSFITFDEIMNKPLPPIEWLIQPIVAQGDRVIVFGEFGSFKSWLLLHLGLHVAAGRPWLEHFPIVDPRRVLFIDEEMNERTLRRRIKRLALGAKIETDNLPFRALSQSQITFDSHGGEALQVELEKSGFDPEVIIIETFRRVLRGSENVAEDVSMFWRNIEPIRKGGRTLLISHHMRKPQGEGANGNRHRASGSTDILAGSDASYAISLLGPGSIALTCVKARNSEEPIPFRLSLKDCGQDEPDGPIEMRFEEFSGNTKSRIKDTDHAIGIIKEILQRNPLFKANTADLISKLTDQNISKRTAERALKDICKSGEVERAGRGWYQLKNNNGNRRLNG